MSHQKILLTLLFIALLPAYSYSQEDETREELKARVKDSVEKSVNFLLSQRTRDGFWLQDQALFSKDAESMLQQYGASALVALALKESGVENPQVRAAYTNTTGLLKRIAQQPGFTYTYSISLVIMLLDRVDNVKPNPVIQLLAKRLLEGQCKNGKWTYHCRPGNNNLVAGDNSNTQFAVVALWIAKRHGANVKNALALTDEMFRKTYLSGWGYDLIAPHGMSSQDRLSASMTCAGLLGIALSAKANRETDAAFRGQNIDDVVFRKDLANDEMVIGARKRLVAFLKGDPREIGHFTYFLWSLERVCLLYRWNNKIEDFDWFGYLANMIMKTQRANGSYASTDIMGVNCETSFTILFLMRSNLLIDPEEAKFVVEAPKGTLKSLEPAAKKPVEEAEISPAELSRLFLAAVGPARTEILNRFYHAKGTEYTKALAELIDKLPKKELKEEPREVLLQRFKKLTAGNLRDYMVEAQPKECRYAAVQASLEKTPAEKKDLIPSIIAFMETADTEGKEIASKTLYQMTDLDFGTSGKRWNDWWRLKGKDFEVPKK